MSNRCSFDQRLIATVTASAGEIVTPE